MQIILTIVFLAALVGVFKPYINGMSRPKFGAAAVVTLIAIGIVAPSPPSTTATGAEKSKVAEQHAAVSEESASNGADVQNVSPSKWQYSQNKDEMRGTITRYANLDSENTIELDFPYGEQRGKMLVRQSPQFGFDILVGVDSGQILCSSYSGGHVDVKFDDAPVQRFGCSEAADGTSNMVFVSGARGFLTKLKKSKHVMLEASFFQNGMQQFTFDTANLNWE